MTHIIKLLDELRQRNISLWLENGRLQYRAPKDALSAELLAQLKTHKAEIIAFLQQANSQKQTQLPTIVAIDRQHPLPLSFAQQRLWFLQQLAPNSTSNNMPVVVRFEGSLNIEILKRSIQELVRRHEVLQTRFPTVNGQPTTIVEPITVELPIIDLRNLPEAERDAEAYCQATEEARQPFDLVNGPIFRLKLFWLRDEEYLLIWNMHCIICDGASSDIFYQDLTAIYQAFVAGQPSPLPELPVQYGDFAHWQQEWLQGEVLESQLSYWKRILEGNLPLIQLPFDASRPKGVQAYKGKRTAKMLPLELNQALTDIGQQIGATQFMILLAAFEVLLYRYSRQDNLLINVASAGRGNVETERLLGFFSNTLLLKADLSGNPTFHEYLSRVKQSSLDAFAHSDIPFEKVVEELHPEQRQRDSSLFQVKFSLNPPWSKGRGMSSVQLPNLKISSLFGYIYHGETTYDLTLVMREQDEGLGMVFSYNADIFAEDTIARMVEHFHTLLAGIVQNPDQSISTLPLLTEAERQQLVMKQSPSTICAPQAITVNQIFEDQVSRSPDAIALITPTQQLTYQALNHDANQLAHHLQSIGVTTSTPVAICIEKSVDMIVAQLAVLKAGGIYIPIDTEVSTSDLRRIIAEAQSNVVITHQSICNQIENATNTIICLDSHQDTIRNQSYHNLQNSSSDEIACILFNEEFVGVQITHRGINLLVQDTEPLNISNSDRFLQWASCRSDISLFEIYTALLRGNQLVLPSSQLNVASLGTFIHQHRISILHLSTRAFHFIVENQLEDLQSVRNCLISGGLISPYYAEKFLQALSPRSLFSAYSTLENTGLVCLQTVQPSTLQEPSRVGLPLNHIAAYILDHHLQPLPIGVEGNLYLGGARVAKGYLNQPQQTQAKFIPNPLAGTNYKHQQAKYLFNTGTQAKRLPDGSLVINNIVSHNEDFEQFEGLHAAEIALVQHPMIKECKLVATQELQENRRSLTAYIVSQEQNITPKEIYEFLKKKIHHSLIPANFVVLEALPLTSLGEVDLKSLPTPIPGSYSWKAIKVSPQNAMERELTTIWKQVLKIQDIGTTDNFFELGGNSLLAMSLAINIEQKLGKALPLSSFFQAPTIQELATVLRQAQTQTDCFSLVPIQPKGTRPPLFCIHFILRPLTSYLRPDQPIYALRYGIATQTTQSVIELPDQVENLAAHYIQEMRRLQPIGPYHLMGSSFGGTIAFEMAQQLHKQGEEVALLAIFDTSLWPRPPKLSTEKGLIKRLKMGVPGLKRSFQYRWSKFQFEVKNKGRYTPHFYWANEGYLVKPYVPQFYPGKVLLFHALAEAKEYQDPHWLPTQWQQTVSILETFNIPGDHNGILQDPHVHTIKRILQNALDDSQNLPHPARKVKTVA